MDLEKVYDIMIGNGEIATLRYRYCYVYVSDNCMGYMVHTFLEFVFPEPAPEIPAGHRCQSVAGFVEELVVNDDPEYQWIDKIRTPRASNEARQTLFSKLSGELQRRIGLKVLELGGNAVIGLVN